MLRSAATCDCQRLTLGQTALNGLIKSLGPSCSREEAQTTALSKLDQVSDRLKGLKRKVRRKYEPNGGH